jgi:hypothetical protein
VAAELERYDEVHGIAVMALGRDGSVLAASRPNPPPLPADGQERVRLALAERVSGRYPLLLPWDDHLMVLAEPVLVDGEARGMAVTVSPTDELRAAEVRLWAFVATAALLALGLGVPSRARDRGPVPRRRRWWAAPGAPRWGRAAGGRPAAAGNGGG